MTSHRTSKREIVRRQLAGLPTARPAVGPLAVHFCAPFAQQSIRSYTTNATALADSVIRYYERFRPDAVWLSADTWVSAEAMGAGVVFSGDNQPLGGDGTARVQSLGDLDSIASPDPTSQGRYPLMVDALQQIRRAVGNEAFVVACFDQYPFSLACALLGLDVAMVKLIEDRPLVEAVMERCLEYARAYALALAEAGADMLSGGDSPAGLVSPRLYREVVLPMEQRLITELKSQVTVPISLHICGDASPILPDMATSGADVLELDHQVDISHACRVVGPKIAIWGNLDPVKLLAHSSADTVRQATGQLLQAVAEARHPRFVLSSGCTLAVETPAENLDAMIDKVTSEWYSDSEV